MTRVRNSTYPSLGIYLGMVALSLFGLGAPAAAADQVPFSASGSGLVTGTARLPGGLTQVDQSFSGNATYLGNFTGTGSGLLDKHGAFMQTSCLIGAARTDGVCIAFSGYLNTPKSSCIGISTGTYTVTGGTGLFATATGGGTITAQYDQCTGTTTATLTGTISQPNSGTAKSTSMTSP